MEDTTTGEIQVTAVGLGARSGVDGLVVVGVSRRCVFHLVSEA